MTITLQDTVKREMEIELPLFVKTAGNRYVAIIDEENILVVFASPNYKTIQSGTKSIMASDIQDAIGEEHISEKDFFDVFNEVHNALSFKAELIETREKPRMDNGSDQAYETLKQLTSY